MPKLTDHTFYLLTLLLGAVTVFAVLCSARMGYVEVSAWEVAQVVLAAVTGDTSLPAGMDEVIPFVVMDVRLPRILTSALVGGGLALSGVIYQAILLNPLADPYTLGVSSGAAFGASLAIFANLLMLGSFSVPIFAFTGAILTLFAVLYLSTFNGQMSANTLILSGVIVGAILSAGISLLKFLADKQVSVIIFWLMGSFASRSWSDVGLVITALLLGMAVSFFYARDLNIMSLGARSSDSLGVETGRVRYILLIAASLVTAICVSVSGIIGFIGLIIPHLMRFLVGPDNRRLLPVSVLAGAILLLTADTMIRAVLPAEVPVGVLTALIGGPFFCFIFRKRQRGMKYD